MVLKSKKHVFWEALVMTIAVFVIGLFLGMLVETGNSEKVSQLYLRSEISLVDSLAVTFLAEDYGLNCESLVYQNIDFANRVYEEARLLEEYEASGTLTESMKFLHQKYDLLRTMIWMSNQEAITRCGNYSLIVYLYDYETDDTQVGAAQNVWSKLLLDIKREHEEDVLLLPIAADQNITSLNLLMEDYGIESLPAIVVNNEHIFYSLTEVERLKALFEDVNESEESITA